MAIIVDIERVGEDSEHVYYEFFSQRDRRGRLRIRPADGQIEIVQRVPGDTDERNFYRAMKKVREAWLSGALPDRLAFMA